MTDEHEDAPQGIEPEQYVNQANAKDLKQHVDHTIENGLDNTDNKFMIIQHFKDLLAAEENGQQRRTVVHKLRQGIKQVTNDLDDMTEKQLEAELDGSNKTRDQGDVELDRTLPVIEIGARSDGEDLGINVVYPDDAPEEQQSMTQVEVADVLTRAAASVATQTFAQMAAIDNQIRNQLNKESEDQEDDEVQEADE